METDTTSGDFHQQLEGSFVSVQNKLNRILEQRRQLLRENQRLQEQLQQLKETHEALEQSHSDAQSRIETMVLRLRDVEVV